MTLLRMANVGIVVDDMRPGPAGIIVALAERLG
jgi:hypothetical protein